MTRALIRTAKAIACAAWIGFVVLVGAVVALGCFGAVVYVLGVLLGAWEWAS